MQLFERRDLIDIPDEGLFNTLFRTIDYSLYTYVSATDIFNFVKGNLPNHSYTQSYPIRLY